MIVPAQKGMALLTDIASVANDPTHFHLWWLGQSGFLLQWNGKRLLFDPYLSDSLTRKYASTDKPHVRMTELVIDPAALPPLDIVTSSHNHTDHLDAETLLPIIQNNPAIKFVIPEANREFVQERLGTESSWPIGLDVGTSIELNGFTIRGVPAAHEKIDKDTQGRCKYLGYVVSFGPWSIYHSGDTILYDGMQSILNEWKIDLALLPINGAKPERRVAGNLNGIEAAHLAHDIGAHLVIPCHYDMFEFNTASPDDFVKTCQSLLQSFAILRAGERWSSRSFA